MALTRSQYIAGNNTIGSSPVLAGQVQGVKQGTGINIANDGTISIDSAALSGVVKTNNPGAFNNYVWPLTTGTPGQVLTVDSTSNLIWANRSTIESISTTSPLTGGGITGPITLGMSPSGVTAGNYTNANITVDNFGRVTSASNGSSGGGSFNLQLLAISPAFDGSTSTFTLSISGGGSLPAGINQNQILIFVGGIVQTPGAAFTLSGNQITFTGIPPAGASFVGYVIGTTGGGGGSNPGVQSLFISPAFNGSTTTFTISPSGGGSLPGGLTQDQILIVIGGIVQTPGVAFTLVGNQITFTGTPPTGSSFVGYFGTGAVGSSTQLQGLIISPAFDGVTSTYTLSPAGGGSLPVGLTQDQMFIAVGGIVQTPGSAFTLSGNQITFTGIPPVGTSFTGYVGVPVGTGPALRRVFITPAFNGSVTSFTLSLQGGASLPAGTVASQLMISVGGILQTPGSAFTLTGNTITFSSAPATGLTFVGYI